MSAADDTRAGLARFLAVHWDEDVDVSELGVASAGARRRNVLFEATRAGGESLRLVATIIPNAAIQVMPMEVEASTLRAARAAGAPAPELVAVSEEVEYVGGPLFITRRVDGETIPRRVLRTIDAHPGLGSRVATQCGEALAEIHRVAGDAVHPDLPRQPEPIRMALAGVRQLLDGLLQPSPTFSLALRWLEKHRPPEPDRLTLVHGDFRNGNLIIGEDGLRAVLDWEVAHLGDPMEDAGWLCQRMWRFRNDALEVGGLGSRADLRKGYEAAGGTFDDARFRWWKIMSTLKWGAGLAGQAAAHLDGTVRSVVMAASGRRIAEMEYDLLMLLSPAYRD